MKLLYSFVFYCLFSGAILCAEDDRPIVDASTLRDENVAHVELPTLHIVGDSTVRSGGTVGMWGWGERISPLFDAKKINVVNHAIGGRSARTFYTEGRWKKVEESIKAGDFVLIQFGHNDQGRIGDPANKGRADGQGIGDEVVVDQKADGTKENVHTFGWYMSQMIVSAKSKKAHVVICSPVPHKQRWENERDFAQVAQWDQLLAAKHAVDFMDLTMIVTQSYQDLGKEKVETFFADKGTHTSDAGAQRNAACVVAGIKSLKDHALEKYLSEQGNQVPAYQAALSFIFDDATDQLAGTSMKMGETFDAKKGYGFDAVSDAYFQFSVKLPEGAYAVVLDCHSADPRAVVTVKSEQRRLMLEAVPANDCSKHPFLVHTRTTRINDKLKVGLKTREISDEQRLWDDQLTIEFFGDPRSVKSITIKKSVAPTLFIAGDSTVCDQPAEPWNSWGQMLPRFFNSEIVVANYAQSGESIKSSLGARRFEKIFQSMKPGDFLLIQFGHNDQKDKAVDALSQYQKNLEMLVDRTRSLGGTPILITSMERTSGVNKNTLGGYPDAVRAVARDKKCGMIELHDMSQELYRALGDQLKMAFQDGTHHNNYGSYQLAKCVVEGIQKSQMPLAKFIHQDFQGYHPSKPDVVNSFVMPASPAVSNVKPLGD